MKKRALSLTLCIPLLFALLPAAASAAPNLFTLSSSAEALVQQVLAPGGNITISGTPTYTGAAGACSIFDAVDFGVIGGDRFALPAGILLTSGSGSPALANTSSGSTADNGFSGDVDVDALVTNGRITFDASVLAFDFTVPDGAKAVELQFLFGSEEYPKYMDTNFVDGAVVMVDGVNYAKFSNGKPLSVTSLAELVPNSGLTIEYNGLSVPKVITALLDPGISTHTVKIAIADTGDRSLDSGLFLSSMKVSSRTGGGVVGTAVLDLEAAIDALPDPVAADDSAILSAQDDILDAKKDFDHLSDYDRSVIDPTRVDKLDKLLVRLEAVLIIHPEDNGVSCEGIGTAVQVPELNNAGVSAVQVELAVTPISAGNAAPNFAIASNSLAASSQQILASYDISLIKSVFDGSGTLLSHETVPPADIKGTIKVRIPLPAGSGSGSDLTVIYIDDSGKITALPTSVVTIGAKKYLEFSTTHFSLYAIIGKIASSDPAGPDPTSYFKTLFTERILTDPRTGITVAGKMLPETALQFNMLDADAPGALGDAIRKHKADGADNVYLAATAKLTSAFDTPLSLSVPVGGAYNGKTATLLQIVNGKAETLTAVVKDGIASFKITSPDSFALFVPVAADDAQIPQTGDANAPYGTFLLIAIAALAGAAVLNSRRRAR